MPKPARKSRGAELAERLARARKSIQALPRSGARTLPVVRGLTDKGLAMGQTLESILVAAQEALLASKKIYTYGQNVVLEVGEGQTGRLIPLATGYHIESSTESLLANFLVCELGPGDDGTPAQFAAPRKSVAQLLNRHPTRAALPRITTYASRPIFDMDFVLRAPGWHPDVGVLVHGPDVEVIMPQNVDANRPLSERLPPHLYRVLGDFCFRSDADHVNALAAMITGVTAANFIESGKPLLLLDGNQPGLGKTLYARTMGMVLDGFDPHLVHYTSCEEELAKKICATLLANPQSVLLVDNAKLPGGSVVSSAVIESNSMSPTISLRILGRSQNFTRPNDVLWALTMNSTRTSTDIVSRGLPIRFEFEGDPAKRHFDRRDPIVYARAHRVEILGELAGMGAAVEPARPPTRNGVAPLRTGPRSSAASSRPMVFPSFWPIWMKPRASSAWNWTNL